MVLRFINRKCGDYMKRYLTKEHMIFFFLFFFFLVLLTLSPISGDDWGNYMIGGHDIFYQINQAFSMYFSWEGRIVSRILINILTYHKWLWNILNAILITSMIVGISKLVNFNNRKMGLCLSILVLLTMNIYTFSQVVVWVAGNITYLFPLAFLLFYFILCKNNLLRFKYIKILICLLQLLLPLFVEHMAILLVFTNIFTLGIHYYKTKKWNTIYLIYVILSIFSSCILLLSPGTSYRSSIENTMFNSLTLVDKIQYNLPNFIQYTFIINSSFLVLLVINNLYLIHSQVKNQLLKIGLNIYMSIIPILTVILYSITLFVTSSFSIFKIIDSTNYLVQIYWISYIIIWLFLLYKHCFYYAKYECFWFAILGLLANAVMLLSPTWGYRTSFATYFFLMISCLYIFDFISIPSIVDKFLIIVVILISFIYLIFYINVRIEIKNREESISNQLLRNSKIIKIDAIPSYANCNINPMNDYHLEVFKKYYQIPEDNEVIIIPKRWRFVIAK